MGNNQNLYQRKPQGGPCSFTQKLFASGYSSKYWFHLPDFGPFYGYSTLKRLNLLEIFFDQGVPFAMLLLPSTSWLSGTTVVGNNSGAYCYTALPYTYTPDGILTNTNSDYVLYVPKIYTEYPSYQSWRVIIDVWKAYADGLWTSSVQFKVLIQGIGAYTPRLVARQALESASEVFSTPISAFTNRNCTPSTWLPNSGIRTVTIYDDGTITIT